MIWFISQDSSVNPLDAFPSPHNSRLRESLSTNSDACLLHTGATQPVLAVQCLASCLFQPNGTNAESAQGRSPENHVYHKVLLVKCRSFIETKSLGYRKQRLLIFSCHHDSCVFGSYCVKMFSVSAGEMARQVSTVCRPSLTTCL